jgi:hypothetical protein
MLAREGHAMNHKRLYRLYREERLMVRRRRGRKRALGTRAPMTLPDAINQRWSLDFVADALSDGRRFRIGTILRDEAAIANAALAVGLAEHQLPSLFSLAAAWIKRLQSDVEVGVALSALVDRVDLIDTGLRVSLKLPYSITEEQQGANATELTITRVFPMQIRRRGFEMRLVIQGSRASAPLVDLALMKAIARGRQWADDLLAGRVESVAVIAKRDGVLPNYVRRLTRLAFLAPRIVEAIVAGHQPPELTAKALNERIELPLLWSEQERAVGIS